MTTYGPDVDDMPLEAVIARLAEAITDTRAREAAAGFAELGVIVNESGYNAAGTELTWNPSTSNLFVVEAIFAYIPVTAQGNLILGDAIFPMSVPSLFLAPVSIPLRPDQVRLLSANVSGVMSCFLSGREMSPRDLIR